MDLYMLHNNLIELQKFLSTVLASKFNICRKLRIFHDRKVIFRKYVPHGKFDRSIFVMLLSLL